MTDTTNKASQQTAAWNAKLYEAKHDFVWKFGSDVLSLLAPQSGERILDLGCGTGHLTAQIADSGAQVLGVDRSPEMIAAARAAYPGLKFEIENATQLTYRDEFNAVFSNATLHWIHEPQPVIQGVWKALRPSGRFVAEFGGKGNIRRMQATLDKVIAEMGLARPGEINPWYYPSVSEYATLLEGNGFEVRLITLFDRLTPLADGENGLKNWITMFGSDYLAKVAPELRDQFFHGIEELLRPELYKNGQWWADYRRLRFIAYK